MAWDAQLRQFDRALLPPVPTDHYTLEGDVAQAWNRHEIPRSELATFLRDTVLQPESAPSVFVRYFTSLEHVYRGRQDIAFLLEHVYVPRSQISAILARVDMNIACLDACTAHNYRDTQYAAIEMPAYLERVDRLLQLSSQAGNVARLVLAYGTDHKPELTDHVSASADREWTPPQKLLHFLFQRAGDQQLRRKHTALYRPRLLEDGTHTGFFEYAFEISDFLYRAVAPSRSYPVEYDALTNKPSTPHQMIQLFTGLPDARCPFLDKSRTLFSYRNGIYDAALGSFETFRDRQVATRSIANFFDCPLQPEWLQVAAEDIATPHFDKILTDQAFDATARRWMYVLCGRLLFDVGTLDDWQVTLYIRGVAGSGKSSILKTMAMMYEAGDIGYMMSDGQATFSDEHLYDKFIVMAMDLDRKTTFSATRINSMTSGEKVSINRKYKTALNETWKPPMVIASNAQPPWPDVAGNLTRRFPILTFNHPVRHSDPQLFDKLKREVPALVVKMSRAYLDAVRDYGTRSLWDDGILPSMCHEAKRQYLITSNPLAAFLASDQLVFQAGLEVDAAEFRRVLLQYTKDNGDRRSMVVGAINAVDHGHVSAMYGCRLEERGGDNGVVRTVIRGVALLE